MSIRPVAELIPHQPPMRLINEVMAHTRDAIWCTLSDYNTPFTGSEGIHSCVGIELLAQTAAAFFTIEASDGAEVRQGMLIASRKYEAAVPLFPLHQPLLIFATPVSPISDTGNGHNLVKFRGEIHPFDPDQLPFVPDTWRSQYLADDAWVTADLSVYI